MCVVEDRQLCFGWATTFQCFQSCWEHRVVADLGERFVDLVWSFRTDSPRPAPGELRATTPESTALAKDLKRRGWRFVGPTTVYAFMQSMGMVDDHLAACWRAEP